jgi:hypothetical protein
MIKFVCPLALVAMAGAATLGWDMSGVYPGRVGDTVIVLQERIEVVQNVVLPAGATLVLQAMNGIAFANDVKVTATSDRSRVLVWSDWNADGVGSFECAQDPCLILGGDSSLGRIVESAPDLDLALATASGQPWAGALVVSPGASIERLIQLNAWSDMLKATQATRRLPTPSAGWGFALGRDMRATSPWLPFMGQGGVEAFEGVVDGQGRVIRGLTISEPYLANVGFVGKGRGVVLRNLHLDSANVRGGSHVGVLAGSLVNSYVDRSSVGGMVQGDNAVGGLVGVLFGSAVRDAHAQVRARGVRHVAGLVGLLSNRSTLENAWTVSDAQASEAAGAAFGSAWQDSKIANVFWLEGSATSEGECSESRCKTLALSEQSIRQRASFPTFDFDLVWEIREGEDYPRLRGLPMMTGVFGATLEPFQTRPTSAYVGDGVFILNGSTTADCPAHTVCRSKAGEQ